MKALGAAILVALALAGAAQAQSTTPSAASIKANLKAAEASTSLWATFNICGPADAPDTVGVRGQMPSLSFATRERMVITLSAFSATEHTYVRIPGHWIESLGVHRGRTLVQQGIRLKFPTPATLVADITFQWTLNHRLIGQVTRDSSGGRTHVGHGDPAGYSVATCSVS